MAEAANIERLFAVWEVNLPTVRLLHQHLKSQGGPNADVALEVVGHLKACSVALVPQEESQEVRNANGQAVAKVDKSTLTFGEVKRIRSKAHLKFVASRACLICGRSPSHAHHIRFAQPKGIGLKVSDEFTVPLCAIHHQENHATGNERQWWQERNLDPLAVAEKLWEESRGKGSTDQPNGPGRH